MRQLSLSRAARPAPCARFALHAIAASLAAAFGTCAIPAWAQLPTGAQVVNGNAGINTNGSQMTITNSPNAVLNWQSFSIGTQNTVHFAQADAASKVLNRVVGNDPSQILGALTSNGSVWLINPNGVLFGQGARIDVGGLVASTMALSNADFLAGRARFDAAGGANREVRNAGAITTTFGGRVWLVGGTVSNAGTITAPGGSIVMAAGDRVEIVDSGLPNIRLQVSATGQTTANTGTVQAVDGKIDLHGGIVNQQGIVRAESLHALGKVDIVSKGNVTFGTVSETSTDALDQSSRFGGDISILSESGDVLVAGSISTRGEDGGTLTVAATRGALDIRGKLDSSGSISGGIQTLNGSSLTVGSLAIIDASGGESGGILTMGANDGALDIQGKLDSSGGTTGGIQTLTGTSLTVGTAATVDASGGETGGILTVTADDGALDIKGKLDSSGGTTGGIQTLTGASLTVGTAATVNASGGETGGVLTVTADDGALNIQGKIDSSGGDGAGAQTLTGSSVRVGKDAVIDASGGGAGGAITVAATRGVLDVQGKVESTSGGHGGSQILSGAGVIIGKDAIIDSRSGNGGGALTIDAGSGLLDIEGQVRSNSAGGGGSQTLTGTGVTVGTAALIDTSSFDGGGALSVNAGDGRLDIQGRTNTSAGSGSGGRQDFAGASISVGRDARLNASSNSSGGALGMTAHNGELDIQGTVYSSGGVAGGQITLSGSTVTIGADGVVAANGGSSGGNIDIRARDGMLATDGRISNAVYEGSGSGNVGMRLTGSSVRIGSAALLDTSRNGTGQLAIAAREGSLDFSGTVMALDSAGVDSRGSVGMAGSSIRLHDGSRVDTNRLVFFTGVSEGAPVVDTLTMQGSTVLAGSRGIHVFASDVNLTGSTLSSDSGPIEIESDRMTLNHATLASNASGTAIRLETRDFSNTSSQLSASAGRWLVYLKKDGRFDADAFADLDYRFVQVDAIRNGEWETPVLSGVGQNGILMADPLAPKLKLVVREYDGTPYANFRDVLSHDLPEGFDVRRSADWTSAQGDFQNKNVGTDKSIALRGEASLFKIQTTKGIDVYGAKPYYVGDIEPRLLTVDLTAADKVYDAKRDASVSASLGNVIEGDNVVLNGLQGLFDTKHVGNDKPVTVTFDDLAGRDAGNYVFRPAGELRISADITPLRVTAGDFTAMDKIYDGTRDAQVTGTLSGILPGDDVEIDRFTGQFDTKNVGSNKTVTISASGAAGRDAGNYLFDIPLTTTASITPREAQIGLTGQVRKVYDGNTVATLAPGQFVLSGILASDAVVIDGPFQGQYDNANAGQNKTVTVTGPFVISGADAINYTYGGVVLDGGAHTVSTTVSGAIGEITRRTLALTGVTAANKVYDARTSATILGGALGNVVAGDDVRIGDLTGTFEDKHAGTGKLVTVSIGGLSGTTAGNYELPAGTATTRADITPRPISVQGLSASDKVYDGRDTASISGTPSSALPGDQLQIGSLEGRFSDKNVGTNKAVIVTGGALSGADAGNYRLDGLGNTTASITPRAAQIGITGQVQKEYDGTQAATLGAGQYALSGILDADAVTVAGPTVGRYDSADAGQGKTVTVSGPFVISGADAINYSFGGVTLGGTGANTITTTATGIGAIMRRILSLSSLVAANKVYDGTVTADVHARLGNVVGDDEVTLGALSGAFESRHAGTGKRVNVSAGALSGADAANYMLPGTAFSSTADITPLTLSAAGIRASDKVYDGNTSASLTGAPTGVLAGDQVTIGTLAGQFDNKNVGTGKTVAISGGALSGADAGNYRLDGRLATTASITPRPVTLALTGQAAKEYDATSSAVLGANQYAMANLVAGDDIGVRGPTQGSYDTPNVGQQKAVSVSGPFDFSGVDAANYSLNGVRLGSGVNASVTANIGRITPAVLTYQANPAVVESTLPFGTLNGTVTGFRGGDTLASATTGQLAWQAGAANGAAPGSYPILGAGLAAANYEFVQAPGNATALVVRPGETIRSVTSSATNAVSAALAASSPVPNLPPASSPVADSTSPGAAKAFSPVRIGSMSQEELAQMLAQRRSFKQNLFSAAIYKLEMDPSLADLQPCTTVMEASSGACRISAAQLELLHAARPQAHVQEQTMGRAVSKTSNLPRIERKIAVLFGVNEYSDKAIPRLENAITDVDAISKLFAEKLGYEVRVLHNPGKAEMIRALNALATEVGSADSVVVYYAGHGYSLEKNGAGYWLPSDAAASDPRQWISNSDVAKILSGIRSRQMALISDSCYSGAFAREGMANVGRNVNADDVLSKRSVVVLSSGGDEPVPDEGRGNHSIFAWNLMQVVGSVANWKPGSTVFEGVQEAVRKEFPQTPQYGALTAAGHQAGGDYLFEFRSR